jgi:hypothetical protein
VAPERACSIASRVVIVDSQALGGSSPHPHPVAGEVQEGFLHDVCGLAHAAHHPVGDGQQQRPGSWCTCVRGPRARSSRASSAIQTMQPSVCDTRSGTQAPYRWKGRPSVIPAAPIGAACKRERQPPGRWSAFRCTGGSTRARASSRAARRRARWCPPLRSPRPLASPLVLVNGGVTSLGRASVLARHAWHGRNVVAVSGLTSPDLASDGTAAAAAAPRRPRPPRPLLVAEPEHDRRGCRRRAVRPPPRRRPKGSRRPPDACHCSAFEQVQVAKLLPSPGRSFSPGWGWRGG